MNDQAKTKEELIQELQQLRQQVTILQTSAAEPVLANGNGFAYAEAGDLNRLSSAVDFLGVGLTISDPHLPDNPLIFVNQGFVQMTGYTAEEAIGRNCRFLQGEGTDPAAVREICTALRAKRSCHVKLLNYRKDGTPFWNELSIRPIFDEAGQLLNFVGLQTDVTAQEQYQQELLKYEHGLGLAAQLLSSNREGDLSEVLEVFREATRIQRIYLYENQMESEVSLAARCIAHAEVATTAVDLSNYPALVYEQAGLTRWRYLFGHEQPVHGAVNVLTSQEQAWLNRADGVMALFPVHIHGRWYGFVGFEHHADVWPVEMLMLCKTFVMILAAHIEGRQIQMALETAQIAQQQKERHTTALLEAIPDVIVRMDRQGNFLSVNLPAEFREDVLKEHLRDLSLRNIVPASDADELLGHIAETFDSATTKQITYDYHWADGERVNTFDVRLSPIDDQELVVFARNITEHLENQAELKQTNLKLALRVRELSALNEIAGMFNRPIDLDQTLEDVAKIVTELFDTFSTYISLYDYKTQKRRIVAGYDPYTEASLRLTGLEFDMRSTPIVELIMKGEIFTVEKSAFHEKLALNIQPVMERRKAESLMIVPLQTSTVVVGTLSITITDRQKKFTDADLQVARVIATQVANAFERRRLFETAQQEIAERIVSQRALEQAHNQAVKANRIKSQILARVSHELRTPLSVIMGHGELLERGIYGDISTEQQRVVREVVGSTRYLTALVDDLLDQARFEREGVTIDIGLLDLRSVVMQIINSMKVLAEVKGLTLDVEIDGRIPEQILGDEKRYQQILFNLLSNAVKYTVEGKVVLQIRPFDEVFWELSVRDTGLGIPEEAQITIFDPFYQLDPSLTSQRLGTGLGLSIVKQLVDCLGGEISLESQPDVGSLFTVRLPWEPQDAESD